MLSWQGQGGRLTCATLRELPRKLLRQLPGVSARLQRLQLQLQMQVSAVQANTAVLAPWHLTTCGWTFGLEVLCPKLTSRVALWSTHSPCLLTLVGYICCWCSIQRGLHHDPVALCDLEVSAVATSRLMWQA